MPKKKSHDEPVSEQACEGLITDIQEGKFRPGEFLPPSKLVLSHPNIGRTAWMYAIHELVGAGILEQGHHRRASVKKYSKEDVAHLFAMRRLCEREAGRLAAKGMDGGASHVLGQNLNFFLQSTPTEDDAPVNPDLSNQLHGSIMEAAQNKFLVQEIDGIRLIMKTFFSRLPLILPIVLTTVREHRDITKALVNRNEKGIQELIEQHVDEREKDVLSKWDY
ncbi:MAG: GntR family transcriptional regulator [Candidatus Peribacteraceae bacterium]|nr:GntR family transcriptional regulator [Candidatus Peribacteraceae bacterium]